MYIYSKRICFSDFNFDAILIVFEKLTRACSVFQIALETTLLPTQIRAISYHLLSPVQHIHQHS